MVSALNLKCQVSSSIIDKDKNSLGHQAFCDQKLDSSLRNPFLDFSCVFICPTISPTATLVFKVSILSFISSFYIKYVMRASKTRLDIYLNKKIFFLTQFLFLFNIDIQFFTQFRFIQQTKHSIGEFCWAQAT